MNRDELAIYCNACGATYVELLMQIVDGLRCDCGKVLIRNDRTLTKNVIVGGKL